MSLIDLVGHDRSALQPTCAQSAYQELREAVSFLLPAVQTAALIESNPRRARNELRVACETVLDERPWLATGQEARERLIGRYLDSVFGFGPLEDLLNDESVTEIMVNGPNALFCERNGRIEMVAHRFANDGQVLSIIDKIVAPLGRRVDESSPMVNARMPEGHRINAIVPPLALDGPVLTIRKFRSHGFTLDELEGSESIEASVRLVMEWAVRSRANIAVSGGTGSGKTTMLNALAACMPEGERILTIEDSAELRFEHPHVVRLEARPRNAEGVGEVTIRDLVANALRMRPDRIVVGECRGSEALDMLQAMNTGHDGSATTLHANSPADAVSRLTTMVRYGAELPVEVIEAQIASAIDLVVQTTRSNGGARYVCEVAEYRFDVEARRCVPMCLYVRPRFEEVGEWIAEPTFLGRAIKVGSLEVKEVASWRKRWL